MKNKCCYQLQSKLWMYPGEQGNWYFVTLPKETAELIRVKVGKRQRGFGAVKVEVTIGHSLWQTSIFPDKTSKSYLLPIKAAVRKAEDLWEGEAVQYSLLIV